MVKVKKYILDELIDLKRAYWNKPLDEKLIDKAVLVCNLLEMETGVYWVGWSDFISAIIKTNGFMPNATNEEIYKCLNTIGVEVVDEIGNCC